MAICGDGDGELFSRHGWGWEAIHDGEFPIAISSAGGEATTKEERGAKENESLNLSWLSLTNSLYIYRGFTRVLMGLDLF